MYRYAITRHSPSPLLNLPVLCYVTAGSRDDALGKAIRHGFHDIDATRMY